MTIIWPALVLGLLGGTLLWLSGRARSADRTGRAVAALIAGGTLVAAALFSSIEKTADGNCIGALLCKEMPSMDSWLVLRLSSAPSNRRWAVAAVLLPAAVTSSTKTS